MALGIVGRRPEKIRLQVVDADKLLQGGLELLLDLRGRTAVFARSQVDMGKVVDVDGQMAAPHLEVQKPIERFAGVGFEAKEYLFVERDNIALAQLLPQELIPNNFPKLLNFIIISNLGIFIRKMDQQVTASSLIMLDTQLGCAKFCQNDPHSAGWRV